MLATPWYHSDGNKLIVVPLFLVTLTLAGILFGYLRFTTDSVWPCAIAHAVHNVVWDVLTGLTVASSSETLEYLAGESGILPILGLSLVVTWIIFARRTALISASRTSRRFSESATVAGAEGKTDALWTTARDS
jgi:CAAX protease family protein